MLRFATSARAGLVTGVLVVALAASAALAFGFARTHDQAQVENPGGYGVAAGRAAPQTLCEKAGVRRGAAGSLSCSGQSHRAVAIREHKALTPPPTGEAVPPAEAGSTTIPSPLPSIEGVDPSEAAPQLPPVPAPEEEPELEPPAPEEPEAEPPAPEEPEAEEPAPEEEPEPPAPEEEPEPEPPAPEEPEAEPPAPEEPEAEPPAEEPESEPAPPPLYESGMESPTFSGWYVQALPGRVTLSTSDPFEGEANARFEVRTGDVEPDTGSSRAEVSGPTFQEGDDLYVRDAIRIPTSNTFSGSWQIIQQLHENDWGGSPGIAVFLDTDRQIHIGAGDGSPRYWDGPQLEKERWYELIYRVHLSRSSSEGFVEVWLDREQQTLTNGQTRAYGQTIQTESTYLKVGIYRSSSSTGTSVIEHDEIVVGTTLESVLEA